jgi:3-hydroxyisobutyrate dehydrogenase-like beta-hydroxyacid dehydrogenase
MDIGFIGIGSMDAAIVPNLVKADHRVAAWNRDPAADSVARSNRICAASRQASAGRSR